MNPIPYITNSRVCALCTFYDSFVNGSSQGLVDYYNAARGGVLKGATAEQVEEIIRDLSNNLACGERSINRFVEYANAMDPDQIDEGYQQFLEKVKGCENMEELARFFRDFDLYGKDSTFKREGKYEGVCLITVHSAKGLEWDTTYLSLSHFDKNDWHRNIHAFQNGADHDESIRKWFVGATRAKEELVITGTYVIPKDRKSKAGDVFLNRFLQKSCEIAGKPYSWSGVDYAAAVASEREEALRQNTKTGPLLTGIDYFRPKPEETRYNQKNHTPANQQGQSARRNPFRRPQAEPVRNQESAQDVQEKTEVDDLER